MTQQRLALIIDPDTVSFDEWARWIHLNNPSFPMPWGEVKWKEWAAQVGSIDGNAPNPTTYNSWKLWAKNWLSMQ